MLKVGLTGGIGSGKTTVAKLFEMLGVPIYYADDTAKFLMNTDRVLIAEIKKHFGEAVYSNNELNRSLLASKVFGNKKKLDLLNSIVHPATLQHADEWMKKQTAPYIIKEAALIFESGAEKMLDKVIGVSATGSLRIKRVMERDGLSEEDVINRMKGQMNEEEKMKLCNFVIINDEKQLLIPQVLALHKYFLSLNE